MRKTTKLECPFLPNLNESSNVPATTVAFTDESDGDVDSAASWKIIKNWAEGLLSNKFDSVKQMAEFISTNYANANTAAAANSSRVLLQKKLLQRKVKGRKKSVTLANVSGVNWATGPKLFAGSYSIEFLVSLACRRKRFKRNDARKN